MTTGGPSPDALADAGRDRIGDDGRVQPTTVPDGQRRAAEAALERRNRRLNVGEASTIGLTEGLAGFTAVLVARLGGSPFEVGLLTSISGLVGLLFVGTAASIVRRRPDIVRTYSRLRLLGYLRYALVAVIVLVVPPAYAIPAILALWAAAAFVTTTWVVATPIVIEGIAGTRGRVDLLAIRWSLIEVGSIVSAAVAGIVLTALGLPTGYALVMAGAAALSVVSFNFARRYRVGSAYHPVAPGVDRPADGVAATDGAVAVADGATAPADVGSPGDPTATASPWRTARSALRLPAFRRHLIARVLLLGGLEAMPPLITLLLVRVLLLEDRDIGVLIAAQRAGAICGYLIWRRVAANRRAGSILRYAATAAAAYPVALALAPSVPVAAAILVWAGLSASGISLGLWNESMRVIPPDRRLPFLGVLYSLDYAVVLVVPILAAAAAQVAGVPAAMAAGGVVIAAGAATLWIQRGRASGAGPGSDRPTVSPAAPAP